MGSTRTRIVRARLVSAARSSVARAAAPLLRNVVARASHEARLEWVRWLVPGSHGQHRGEILAFAELASSRNPVCACEIGTLMGGTSLFLAGLAPSLRAFVGIDLTIQNGPLISALAPANVDVTHIEGSSRDHSVRQRLEDVLDGRLLDLLFIDGDHAYDGVKRDFVDYRSLVAPGGLVAFHDIVPDKGGAFWSGGVPQFWGEVRDRFEHWEFVDRAGQDAFGIGVIKHDPAIEFGSD